MGETQVYMFNYGQKDLQVRNKRFSQSVRSEMLTTQHTLQLLMSIEKTYRCGHTLEVVLGGVYYWGKGRGLGPDHNLW